MQKKQKKVLILVIVFVLVLAVAGILYQQLSKKATPDQLGTQTQQSQQNLAPDFTVYDADGNPVKLSDFRGKPVVINFWASWCGNCVREMPHFEAAAKKYDGEIQFMMVNLTDGQRETRASADAFIAKYGYRFPVFYDTDLNAANTYRAYALPTTYFIDAEGHLTAKATGALEAETLQKGIDKIHA